MHFLLSVGFLVLPCLQETLNLERWSPACNGKFSFAFYSVYIPQLGDTGQVLQPCLAVAWQLGFVLTTGPLRKSRRFKRQPV
jgi:hypothetical protein